MVRTTQKYPQIYSKCRNYLFTYTIIFKIFIHYSALFAGKVGPYPEKINLAQFCLQTQGRPMNH